MNREEFRNSIFTRDNHRCVICHIGGTLDAHHILERRLWPTEGPEAFGYLMDNGVSLCPKHHLDAESTVLSCVELRRAAGIEKTVLPPQLTHDDEYDKWGNVILADGRRLRGELFDEESVQRILEPVLSLFTPYIKYPRTPHVPWSPGMTKDDLVQTPLFAGEIVQTAKLDGENTTLYRDFIHARSLNPNPHPSRHWVKNLHSRIAFDIPEGWRICGENMYAAHSIQYENLDSYFFVFSIWTDRNECLSWDDTVEWAELLGLSVVPVLFRGDASLALRDAPKTLNGNECEGYVMRPAQAFAFKDFRAVVRKWVRSGHVTTHAHWLKQTMTPNRLK